MSESTNRNKHTNTFAAALVELCGPNVTAVSQPTDDYTRVWITTAEGARLRITIEDEEAIGTSNEVTITMEKLIELRASVDLLRQFDKCVPGAGSSISWEGMLKLIKEGKITYGFWLAEKFNFSGIIANANGSREWYLNGKCHREDGPAVERANGSCEWYLNGICHRENGPAVEWADGYRAWYLDGVRLSEEEFNAKQGL